MRTIAIINQKGGCGKTTSAINLAGMFAHAGRRTLLVDLDPQSHCAAGLAIPEQRVDLDVGDALLAEQLPEQRRLIWRACRNLDLIPSRMRLAGLEASAGGLAELSDREHRLRRVLAELDENYDACFIDCPPSIGLLTFNALVAADVVVVPVETSFFSLQGATRQLSTIKSLGRRLGRDIPTLILPTIHDASNALAEDLLDELRRRFGRQVIPRHIRSDFALREAASFGQPVVEYDPESAGSLDYAAVAQIIAERLELGTLPTPAQPPIFEADAPTSPGVPSPRMPDGSPAADATSQPTAGAGAELPAVEAKSSADAVTRASAMRRAVARLSSGRSNPGTDGADDAGTKDGELAPGETILRVIDTAAPPVHESAKRLLGITYTTHGVLFVQPLTAGRSIAIAGTFNDHSTTEHLMQRNRELGIFELCIPMTPGRHSYRLIVEGRAEADPFNAVVEHAPDGSRSSILDVPATTPSKKPDSTVEVTELPTPTELNDQIETQIEEEIDNQTEDRVEINTRPSEAPAAIERHT